MHLAPGILSSNSWVNTPKECNAIRRSDCFCALFWRFFSNQDDHAVLAYLIRIPCHREPLIIIGKIERRCKRGIDRPHTGFVWYAGTSKSRSRVSIPPEQHNLARDGLCPVSEHPEALPIPGKHWGLRLVEQRSQRGRIAGPIVLVRRVTPLARSSTVQPTCCGDGCRSAACC